MDIGGYQIRKELEFYTAFNTYVTDTDKCGAFWNFFNEKRLRISEKLVSYRLINHWEKEGLLTPYREEDGGWRKYSLMDIIWILVVKELRHLGLGLPQIKSVRSSLISRYNQCEYGELEFYASLAYINRTPVFVLAFSNGRAEAATAYEIIDSTDKYGVLNHISINLNHILQSVFPQKQLKPIYRDFVEVDGALPKVSAVQGNPDILDMKLFDGQGKPMKMGYTVEEAKDSTIARLIMKNPYQNILIKVHQGKVAHIERTVYENIENK